MMINLHAQFFRYKLVTPALETGLESLPNKNYMVIVIANVN